MGRPPEIKVHRSITKALQLFDADRLHWLDAAAAEGPLVALRLGPVTTWVVTDPELARTILVSDGSSWSRPPATRAPIQVGVGENLFSLPDKEWARVQPLVAPALRRRALEPRLAEIDGFIDDDFGALPRDATIDLELAMGCIALRVSAWVLLGDRLDPGRAQELAHHQREIVRWIGLQLGRINGFLPFAFGARARAMRQHRAVLDQYADEVIAKAQRRNDGALLGALVRAQPSGQTLTREQLRGHVLGLFLAGNETTAAALSWVLVHAAQNPAEWDLVRSHPDARTEPFLTETLRLTPAVWGIPRTPNRSGVTLSVDGVTTRVRRGQLATIYVRGLNRDADRWPDPLRFDPSRHLGETKERSRALIPFGLGSRGCIGQHLALAEMRAILPALAQLGAVTVDRTIVEDASFALRVSGGFSGRFTGPSSRTLR
jgi:cytochrome P450